jgi:lipoprotein-anchoring transpeptidase ErfK/SrfK
MTATHKLLAGLAVAAGAFAAPAAGQAHAATTVKLLAAHAVADYPGGPGKRTVRATRPVTGSPTVLPVLGRTKVNGNEWLRVRMPARPNSSSGWISVDATVTGSNPWAIALSRGARRATITRSGRVARRFRIVIGKPSTPTPTGDFFVAEVMRVYGTDGPYALMTSAYSNVLQHFAGGPGQIGMHGRIGLEGDPVGSAASHGCIRFNNGDVTWLARNIPAGTTTSIR